MYKHLIVVGAGGYDQAVADLVLSTGKFEKVSGKNHEKPLFYPV
jgi:hypothetical protein